MNKNILVFALLLILGFSYAATNFSWIQPTDACETISLQDSPTNWLFLSLLGVFTVFGIAVAVYLIGKTVNIPQISAWGKNEMWQIIASVILIVLLLALIEPLNEIGKLNNPSCPHPGDCDGRLCGGGINDRCSLLQSSYYYSEAMASELGFMSTHLFVINTLLKSLYSYEFSITPFNMIGVSYDLSSMFSITSKITDWSLVVMGPAILSWIGNMFILCFASGKMLAIFLPLGLILRSFPSTRSVGGGLIALALGLYFVYPFMLNINNVIMSSYMGLESPSELINYAQKSFLGISTGLFNRPGREITMAIVTPLYQTAKNSLTNGVLSMYTIYSLNPPLLAIMISNLYLNAFYSLLQEAVYLVMIGSFVLPLFNIFITFTFIQEIGKFIGSDMNMAELVKLI